VSTDASGAPNRLQRLPPIDTPSLLKSKIEMVEALGEIELASRVIDTKGGAFDRSGWGRAQDPAPTGNSIGLGGWILRPHLRGTSAAPSDTLSNSAAALIS
jgi:hypothetical protein